MHKLVHGALNFRRHIFSAYRDLFQRLAEDGQRPQALFIGCSDSRVVPSLITSSDPGDLFIVRNVGNLVPPHESGDTSVASAVEFALGALGVKDVILCGHTRCGAMRALLGDNLPGGALGQWLANGQESRRLLDEYYGELISPDERLERLCQVNILVQLDRLKGYPIVAERLAKGQLHLHAWLLDLDTAHLSSFDPEQERFLPIEEKAAADAKKGAGRDAA